jgi:hypothetical protein
MNFMERTKGMIEFDTCLITRDMILYEGLKQKDYQNIMSWKDFWDEYL